VTRRRPFSARLRHPVSGRQFRVSGRTPGELALLVAHVDGLRTALRVGAKSPADVERELRRLTHGPVTLERAALAYARMRSENTAKAVRSFLAACGKALAPLELEQLDAPRLAKWIEGLRASNAETSVLRYWRTLRSIARYAAEQGWLAAAPWGMWRPSRVVGGQRPASREAARSAEELEQLFAAARALDAERAARGKCAHELEAKMQTKVLAGLRQGELAGLRWSDLDWHGGTITIARQYDGRVTKGKKPPKTIAVLRELFDVLREHALDLEARELYEEQGPIFPSPRYSSPGKPRHYQQGQCLSTLDLRCVVEKAHLPNVADWSPHSLRDTFATLENEASGGDLAATSQRTRHASIGSLVRYLRSRSRELAPAQPITLGARGLPPALSHKK
jgi:integrase